MINAKKIRKTIKHMNSGTDKLKQRQRLKQASLRAKKESMKINKEFSQIDYDPGS